MAALNPPYILRYGPAILNIDGGSHELPPAVPHRGWTWDSIWELYCSPYRNPDSASMSVGVAQPLYRKTSKPPKPLTDPVGRGPNNSQKGIYSPESGLCPICLIEHMRTPLKGPSIYRNSMKQPYEPWSELPIYSSEPFTKDPIWVVIKTMAPFWVP